MSQIKLGFLGKQNGIMLIPVPVATDNAFIDIPHYNIFNFGENVDADNKLYMHLDNEEMNFGYDFSNNPNFIKKWHPKEDVIEGLKKEIIGIKVKMEKDILKENRMYYTNEIWVLNEAVDLLNSEAFSLIDEVAIIEIFG